MTLQLTDVTLTYPDGDRRLTALDRIDLTVSAGRITALVGPSGSGKSSLLAVAATLVRPDTGQVWLDGTDLAGLRRAARTRIRRDRIGIVFQSSPLPASFTAVEQLLVVAHLSGRSPAGARPAAMDLLDAVGLAAVAHRRPHQLSGGQRQRVAIARALVNRPTALLVDEPTSALDTARGAMVVGLLRRLTAERELTTLLVTHDRHHLTDADTVVAIVDGRICESADH